MATNGTSDRPWSGSYSDRVDTFEFAFAERYRPMLRLIGVTPNTALVTVSDDELRVRFGAGG